MGTNAGWAEVSDDEEEQVEKEEEEEVIEVIKQVSESWRHCRPSTRASTRARLPGILKVAEWMTEQMPTLKKEIIGEAEGVARVVRGGEELEENNTE